MMSISSLPNRPDSPAWGFKAATPTLGFFMAKSLLRAWQVVVTVFTMSFLLIFSATSRNGQWIVTRATLSLSPASIIT